MRTRIVVLSTLILIGVLGGLTPPQGSIASAAVTTGTIAYVVPDDTAGDQIWLVEPDGSRNRKMYDTGEADPYGVEDIGGLAWRPESAELVFASNHEQGCSWYASDLYARDFSLSPDGQRIIFELAPQAWGTPHGGASDLWKRGIDGSNAKLSSDR